ncbi:MAG: prolipoprotein diacylglyceryl transferase [Desulfosarcinaceae bacterium]
MTTFLHWWQHLPSKMDPVIFHIGSFKLQYYGLMYLVAFGLTYFLANRRIKREKRWQMTSEDLQGLLTAMILGLIVGARIGYVLIYNFGYFTHHLLEIFLPFSFDNGFHFTGISGMSYHGGLVGAILCAWWYIRKHKLSFRRTADLLIPCIPIGYTFGRLGNFINGELWGRVTTSPIGMYFPHAPGTALRHPSQLYEAFGEGIVLFVVLWILKDRIKTPGAMLAIYLIGYGVVRFVLEYFRQPDAQIGFVLLSFSMGQVLCSLMILAGVGLLLYYSKTPDNR